MLAKSLARANAAAGDANYNSITPTNDRSFMLSLIEAANAADGNPVPEPATLGLFGVGVLGLLPIKRSQASRKAGGVV